MATVADYTKDPDAVLDFIFDWSLWLGAGESITTSVMTPSHGITKVSDSNTSTSATAWISGGTTGQVYRLSNKITTNQGRTDERSITIRCQNR